MTKQGLRWAAQEYADARAAENAHAALADYKDTETCAAWNADAERLMRDTESAARVFAYLAAVYVLGRKVMDAGAYRPRATEAIAKPAKDDPR